MIMIKKITWTIFNFLVQANDNFSFMFLATILSINLKQLEKM